MKESVKNHGKRANAVVGARPEREFKPTVKAPKRRIPSMLEPATFAHVVGLEADHEDPTLEAAQKAFNGMSRALTDLYARERTIRADGSQTAANHEMRIAQVVDKNLNAPANFIERSRHDLLAEIKRIDLEIENSFRTQMSREHAAELRTILRSMPKSKRHEYLTNAMKEGNFAPLAAVLAHPEAVVSGMTATERGSYRYRYEQALHGDAMARRERLTKAVSQLEHGWQRYIASALDLRDSRADDIAAAARAANEAVGEPIELNVQL